MKMSLVVKHHDHAYVERRGGFELYTHLRGAPGRVAYRRDAIDRAWHLYDGAAGSRKPDAELGGLGLIVVQRALVAAEDLGGLLHGFAGPDPWRRLRQTGIDTLDAGFRAAATNPGHAMSIFRMPDRETFDGEGLTPPELDAIMGLRELTEARWMRQPQGVAEMWLRYRAVAKATMHGFPIVPGDLVVGPPGAGELAVLVIGLPIYGVVSLVHAVQGGNKVPAVVGQDLNTAEQKLKDAGLNYKEVQQTEAAFGIVNKNLWYVCDQKPPAGSKSKNTVKLFAKHFTCQEGNPNPAPSTPAAPPAPSTALGAACSRLSPSERQAEPACAGQ
jgi:hypothetical protein